MDFKIILFSFLWLESWNFIFIPRRFLCSV